MKRLFLYFFITFLLTFQYLVSSYAQSIPVGFPIVEDYYRKAQLLGQLDSSVSFTVRPFFPKEVLKIDNGFNPSMTFKSNCWNIFNDIYNRRKSRIILQLLPITIIQQYNSDHADGINDGIMIPSRGYQAIFSAGIFLKYGPLSIQLYPEIDYAQNQAEKNRLNDSTTYNLKIAAEYADYYKVIDLPNRFGAKHYKKISWGQSSIRLKVGPISLGLSNENLWWGPGVYNSLLMTNNAPGFKHITLNTIKPIRTKIGSFEGQIIAGSLVGSGFSLNKPNDWRYLNGMILSYQPRWVPGLFMGVTRSYQTYHKDMGKSFSAYMPIFALLTKKTSGGYAQDNKGQDQLASLFMRWFWIKGNGEIYFEFGREDHSWNIRDLMMEPTHSAAYILGLRKLIPIDNINQKYFQINLEITQLEMDNITINRQGASWYTHYQNEDGYTNNGQIIGAGIGPGSNLQTINISWNNGFKSIGIQFDRYVHNNDFFHTYIKDIRTNWVDLSGALISEWNYKNLLLNMRLKFVRSKNYRWQYSPIPSNSPDFWNKTHDIFNFHGQLGITYRF